MSTRSWFYASGDKEQGPCSEKQLRELIAQGVVTADTWVWSDGMADWQRAADIPGLLSSVARRPPIPVATPTGSGPHTGALWVDFGVWSLFWRTLLLVFGSLLIVPAPWLATNFYRWFIAHSRLPNRSSLVFTGKPGDIWYIYVLMALCTCLNLVHSLTLILVPVEALLSWFAVRWIIANISSEQRQLSLTFEGSAWSYVGWQILAYLSVLTIVGWAWVFTAWMRWICRNIADTEQDVVFNGSGLEVLGRAVVSVLLLILIIPIPWALHWNMSWFVSQIAVVDKAASSAVPLQTGHR
jgi:uncharacterized protein DUF4339